MPDRWRSGGRFGPIEWATASRSRPGESECGDQTVALDVDGEVALFGVLDGLGHGPAAADAALAAVDALAAARTERVEVLIALCHRVLAGTRGAAMTLAQINTQTHKVSWTGIGNVTAHLVAKSISGVQVRSSARLVGGIVGFRIPETRPAQVVPIRTGDLLVMVSDGIAPDYLDNIDFAASATDIAEQILSKYGKDTDDATVLAARHRGISS